jgi:hypothetical protein
VEKGIYKGWCLVENGLTHLQYVDDTVIFQKNNESNLRNMKFILYCFEAISGMKINFDKSEAFVISADKDEQQ